MKKTMLILGAGLILMTASAAAEPVTITGDASVRYQRDTADGEVDKSGSVYTIRIMGVADLGSGWSTYTRLGAQNIAGSALADFNQAPEVYGQNKKSVVALDQFGLLYRIDKLTYKLGRQDAAVGTKALLYSRPDSGIGKKIFVDGLTVSGTVGSVDISLLAAREDNPSGTLKNKVYALRSAYSFAKNFSGGITLGHYSSDKSTNHWAVDGTYTFGKNSVIAEYTKASSDTNNKAYAVVWNYEFDNKLSASVAGFRVEEFGSMGQQSDLDVNTRGWYCTVSYKINDTVGLDVGYKNQKTISEGKKSTSFETTLNYTF